MAEEPKPKSWLSPHVKAAGLSHFFPGIGQFYNRQYVKGGLFMGATLVALVAGVVALAQGFSKVYGSWVSLADPNYDIDVNPIAALGPGLLLLGVCITLFLWSIVDAWKVAKRQAKQQPAEAEAPPPPSEPRRAPVLPPPPPG